jgi:nicotinamidase-related amidase
MASKHFTTSFNIDDTAVVLIDHQIGTCGWVHSIEAALLEKNVKILATFATATKMPLVLTSSMETNMQGLLLEVIQKAAPEAYEKRIKRQGVVNAWDDPAFVEAVRKTGKTQLIVAGVTTDVCLVPPALSMQNEGFHIKCVLDAGGSPTSLAEQISWQRLSQAGVPMTSTNAVVTELIKDWSTPAGQLAFPLLA